jgi:hypothetical protein
MTHVYGDAESTLLLLSVRIHPRLSPLPPACPPAPAITVRASRIVRSLFSPFPAHLFYSCSGRPAADQWPPHRSGAPQTVLQQVLISTGTHGTGTASSLGVRSDRTELIGSFRKFGHLKTETDRLVLKLRTEQVWSRLVRFGLGYDRTNRAR